MSTENNNLENESQSNNANGLGRKTGSKNKLTKEAKSILFSVLKNDLSKIDKILCGLPFNERVIHLKQFTKFLASGNDTIANDTREILYKQLKPHFNKIGIYANHIDQNKKLSELRAFLKLLGPDMIEETLNDMQVRQKVKFSR
jgi:hypothetical protein